jgi:hypothetical protein
MPTPASQVAAHTEEVILWARYCYQVDVVGRNIFACLATRAHASTVTKCITSRSSRRLDSEKKKSMDESAASIEAPSSLHRPRNAGLTSYEAETFRAGERPCPSSAT